MMMEVEKRSFFFKIREKMTIFQWWEIKLKMKDGRFGVEKKWNSDQLFPSKSKIPDSLRLFLELKT